MTIEDSVGSEPTPAIVMPTLVMPTLAPRVEYRLSPRAGWCDAVRLTAVSGGFLAT